MTPETTSASALPLSVRAAQRRPHRSVDVPPTHPWRNARLAGGSRDHAGV